MRMRPGGCEHWLYVMEKLGIPMFECYKDPATLGLRWTRWLTSFELYKDGKGLIIEERVDASKCQQRRALLLHQGRPDVQDVFSMLPKMGIMWPLQSWMHTSCHKCSFINFPKTPVRWFSSLQRVLDRQRETVHLRTAWIIKFGICAQ